MKPVDLEAHALVRATWIDSAYMEGWSKFHLPRAIPIVSVGFVTGTDDVLLTLCATVAADGEELNPLSIPWGAISELERLTK